MDKPLKAIEACAFVLNALRMVRDNCPKEWDAIMKTPEGGVLIKAWDKLKETLGEES